MSENSKKDPSTPPPPPPAYAETVEEITRIYKSLPPRPSIEAIEAATSVLHTTTTQEQTEIEEITTQLRPQDAPPELFSLLGELRKTAVLCRSHEQRKEAAQLVELERLFQAFDELIQRAADLVSGGAQSEKKGIEFSDPIGKIGKEIENSKIGILRSSSTTSTVTLSTGEADTEKLSLLKVAALIENYAKEGAKILDLQGKLMEKIEWLPVSLAKLTEIAELNLSENRIMALPATIGNLKALTRLDLHSNQIINLPDSFGQLLNLADLDLHANRLKSLPPSFGNLTSLVNLNLSCNNFTNLPNIIGDLTSLKTLNVETNVLEEVPYTIGSCVSLVELRLDFNELKALPEAIGKLECLETLTLHYNRIKGLPMTMGNLSNLREFDVSFNELGSIPESLCFAMSLKKLNLGNNFADLRELPKSIGNLEMLEELDISDDQIRTLPDSFRFLSKLRVICANETPLEVPPREVIKLGAKAVVQYMDDLAAKRDLKFLQQKKKKGFWSWIAHCFGI